jgi:hypothetical protein
VGHKITAGIPDVFLALMGPSFKEKVTSNRSKLTSSWKSVKSYGVVFPQLISMEKPIWEEIRHENSNALIK